MSAHIRVGSITLTLLLPMLFVMLSTPISMQVQAADSCSGDTSPIRWNETAQRMALVPFYSGNWWDSWFEDDDRRNGRKGNGNNNQDIAEEEPQTPPDTSLNPEEPWMYEDWALPRLEPLEENHYTTMLIGNDSVGALRVNLSANYRTTVCIRLQDMNLNAIDGDVYLLTTEQYDSYATSYESTHQEDGYSELEQSLSNIPPEWRSFNFLGWKSYRDSHEYEKTSEVNFALNLDGPEVYTSLFSDSDWQDFYIVIDTWDNVHDGDADAPNSIVAADVTIITTERSLILPPFTVSLVFFVVLLGTLSLPFILNAKYMRAGLVAETPQNIVPSLNTAPEYSSLNPLASPSAQEALPPLMEAPKDVVQIPGLVSNVEPLPQMASTEQSSQAKSELELL